MWKTKRTYPIIIKHEAPNCRKNMLSMPTILIGIRKISKYIFEIARWFLVIIKIEKIRNFWS